MYISHCLNLLFLNGIWPGGSYWAGKYSAMENPMDRAGWKATVHGVANSHNWSGFISTHTYDVVWSKYDVDFFTCLFAICVCMYVYICKLPIQIFCLFLYWMLVSYCSILRVFCVISILVLIRYIFWTFFFLRFWLSYSWLSFAQ